MMPCYFKNIQGQSTEWIVRPMNFGQLLKSTIETTEYTLTISIFDVDEISKNILNDIKEDVQKFPDDWGDVGKILQSMEDPSFLKIQKLNPKISQEFIEEFSFNILNALEMKKYQKTKNSNYKYILNTIEEVQVENSQILISGIAALSKNF